MSLPPRPSALIVEDDILIALDLEATTPEIGEIVLALG
jgi:hypothetical protein